MPGLMAAAGLPMIMAVGSSRVAVIAFGATTAAPYALSGLIDGQIAGLFVLGGLLEAIGGRLPARRLAVRNSPLTQVIAGIVAGVGAHVVVRSASTLWCRQVLTLPARTGRPHRPARPGPARRAGGNR